MPVQRTKKQDGVHQRSVPVKVEPSQRPAAFAFAPNVTPGTFTDTPSPAQHDLAVPQSILFPDAPTFSFDNSDPSTFASSSAAAAGSTGGKKKVGHGRKKPENHIPRPPNAFILFRSSFIKQQHVTAAVETNHSTLSKIIGMTWQQLPPDERNIWHAKAKAVLDDHRRRFPAYAFKPAPADKLAASAAMGAPKPKPAPKAEKRKLKEIEPKDMVRCAKIAALLCEGKKGAELDAAVEEFDKHHVKPEVQARFEAPLTVRAYRRRSSSVPVPDHFPGEGSFKVEPVAPPRMSHPRASSADPTEELTTPIEVEFNMDMFSHGAHSHSQSVFAFEAPANTTFFESDFSFRPATLDSHSVNPHTPVYGGVPPPSADGFDPSMPPLVDRPFDPATDLPAHLSPYPHAASGFPSGPGGPRLSINTLSLLEQLAQVDPASGAAFTPSSPGPYSPGYDAPTPPPLSSCASSQESMSTPSTPIDGSWGWPSPSPQQAHSPDPDGIIAAFHRANQDAGSPAGYAPEPVQAAYSPQPCQQVEYAHDAYAPKDYSGFSPCAGTPGAATVTFRVNYTEPSKAQCTESLEAGTVAPWNVHASVPTFSF